MPAAHFHISVPSLTSIFAFVPRCASLTCGIQSIRKIQKIQKASFSERLNLHSNFPTSSDIHKSSMAGLKRKQVANLTSSTSSGHKKPKNEASQSKKAPRVTQVLETETDSDPIVESDTTEHSGVDDGVSWPSDAASAVQDLSANEEGGVTVRRIASKRGSKVVQQPPSANHARNGMIPSTVIIAI